MSLKLKQRSAEKVLEMNVISEGIMGIRRGIHPKILEEQLNIFLTNEDRRRDTDKKDSLDS